MFLSRQSRPRPEAGTALTGPVTLPGEALGVWLEGERRGVAVYAPGGYHWVPALGQEVLVLKTGERGEKPCAVGVPADAGDLLPGEVMICADGCSIKLCSGGEVEITGHLTVNGKDVALVEEEKGGA